MRTTIAYANLRAEMGRVGVTITDLAAVLKKPRDTLSRKLSRRTLDLNEAMAIRGAFFPEESMEYLFEESLKSSA